MADLREAGRNPHLEPVSRPITVAEKVEVIERKIQPLQIPLDQLGLYLEAALVQGFVVTRRAEETEQFVRYEYVQPHRQRHYWQLVNSVVREGHVGIYLQADNPDKGSWLKLKRSIRDRQKRAGVEVGVATFRYQ